MSHLRPLVYLTLALLITACGGGGGGGDSGSSGGSAAPSGSNTASGGSSTSGGSTANGSGKNTNSAPATPSTPGATAQTITLSWISPSTREDGSALPISELTGYEIYYYLEQSPNDDSVVTVAGGSTRSAQIELTATGTYYFAIAAVDNNGLVSNLSNYVSLAVN